MIALSFSAPCYDVNTECKQTHRHFGKIMLLIVSEQVVRI